MHPVVPSILGLLTILVVPHTPARADYLTNARAAIKKGDLRSAHIELRNAVRNDPQNSEAHYWLARISLELGDPVAAERSAIAARERGYDPAQSIPLLAQAMLAQNKFEALLDTLKSGTGNQSLDASILVSRGYAQIGLKRPEDAQRSFAEAQRIAPNAVEPLLADARLAVARTDLADAEAKIDRAIAAQPKSAEALLAKSQLFRLKSDSIGAIAVLDELIRDQPSIMQARLDRASLALALGNSELAKADIDIVLKGSTGNVQGIYLRAVLSAQARNFKAADQDLERISAYLGRIQRAYYLLAIVKEQLGQYEQAEEAARRYLGRNPNDLSAYKILARIQAVKRRPDQVIETLTKVVESGKGDAEAYDLLGRAYAATGQSGAAVKSLERAQALAPGDIGLQTRLASVRMSMGDVQAAVGDLEQTLRVAPKIPVVGEALFFASLATGDPKRVDEALEKIEAAQGHTEITKNLRGLYKLAMIDFLGALKIFEALASDHPDFVPAQVNLARVLNLIGRYSEGERILSELVSKAPTVEPALGMLLTSYLQSSRNQLAISTLERALASEPSNTRLRVLLGELYIRYGFAQKALDLTGKDRGANLGSAEVLSLRAAAHMALGQKREAQNVYAEILKLDPNVLGARRQLTALLIETGEFEAARGVLQAGIAIAPRNYQLYQDYALVDLRATGVEAALSTAERLASQDREFTMLRALKGDIYLSANRPADAYGAFRTAYQESPSSLLVNRAAGAALRSRNPDEAISILSEWLRISPEDQVTLEQLAEIYITLGRYSDAAQFLEQIVKRKPYEAVPLNNLAWVYHQLGDPRAYELARLAYLLAPGPQTADTLGWILTTQGKPDKGLVLTRQAYLEAPNDPRIRFHYGVSLKDMDDRIEAIRHLRVVAESGGEFKEKAEAQELLKSMERVP